MKIPWHQHMTGFLAATAAAFALVCVAHGAEMKGGTYAVEVSALTMGGGRVADAGTEYTLWSSLSPGMIGGESAGGSYSMFAAEYTPLVPEPAWAAAGVLVACARLRRREA